MWIFLKDGFFSIVHHKYKPGFLLIRCRNGRHMADVFPDAEMYELADADYRYRADVAQEEVARIMAEEVMKIDEPNFKATITKIDYYNACIRVWRVMDDYGVPYS